MEKYICVCLCVYIYLRCYFVLIKCLEKKAKSTAGQGKSGLCSSTLHVLGA